MTDVVNFNQYKSDMRLSSIGHPSTEEAIYNGVHEAVFFFKSKMDAQGLLAYARSIKSEKLQKHLLIVASSFGLLEVMEMLIDKGIDINSRDPWGRTALMVASAFRHLNVVKVLINAGAGIDLHDNNGWTALNSAFNRNSLEIVECLLNNGANHNLAGLGGILKYSDLSLLGEESIETKLAVLELLLKHGANPNVQDDNGNTPLMKAVIFEFPEIIKLLLKYGADLEIRANSRCTAIMYAAYLNNLHLVKLLIDEGAEYNSAKINLVSNYLDHYLASQGVEGMLNPKEISLNLIKFLLEKGINPNQPAYQCLPLVNAIKIGNIELVQMLLDYGADANMRYDNGLITCNEKRLPITEAATNGYYSIVKLLFKYTKLTTIEQKSDLIHSAIFGHNIKLLQFLLDNGIDINSKDTYGYTPLHLALSYGTVETIKFLLSHGADPKIYSPYGSTLLIDAAGNERIDVLKTVLEFEEDINAKDHIGKTALTVAAEEGRLENVRLLIDKGADIADGIGLLKAAKNDHVDVINLLLKNGANANVCDDDGYTTLTYAILNKHTDTISLIKQKISSQEFIKQTNLAFILAAKEGKLDIVSNLLANGIDINIQDASGDTALIKVLLGYSFFNGAKYKVANFLLEKGANISIVGKYRNTALLAITEDGEEVRKIAMKLIEKGADINLPNQFGKTPLINSMGNRGVDFTELLLSLGADVNKRDSSEYTAFIWAVIYQNIPVVKLLLKVRKQKGWDKSQESTALCEAIEKNNSEIINLLLEHNFDLNSTNREGYTPLNVAIIQHNFAMFTKLIDKGADLYIKNKHDQNLIHIASKLGDVEVLNALMKYNIDINEFDNDGKSPLIYAVLNGHLDSVKYLLSKGASPFLKDKSGNNPSFYAAEAGFKEVATFLKVAMKSKNV